MIDRCRRNVATISNELIPSSELSELCTNHCKREQIDTFADIFVFLGSDLSRYHADNSMNHLQLAKRIYLKQLGSHISFLFSFNLICIFYFLFPKCKLHAYTCCVYATNLATSVIVAACQVADSDLKSASASDVPVTKLTATV